MSDHEILIQLCERVDLIYELLTNHLHHHFLFGMSMLGIVGGLVTALLVIILRKQKN